MTSVPFNHSTSSAFHLLHPQVKRWIWQQRWSELREIQERAIVPILLGNTDVIISAATAGGKTEAAFLPIFSRLVEQPASGVRVLYISPLKALINDQYRRLSDLGEHLDIPIHPWHGDIDASRKQKVLQQPSGILLITPESLEALFVRRGHELAAMFQALNYLVIDELHSFIGVERGKQLQSLMHRLELIVGRTISRIGLSATLGDMALAAGFLRSNSQTVLSIASNAAKQELKIQVRGYRQPAPELQFIYVGEGDSEADDDDAEPDTPSAEDEIAAHLFKVLRGTNNLIFMNRRSDVEAYTDRLRRLCEQHRVPNEFLPHHGNLSKERREDAEQALRGERPANVVCTTTLEMGIDIGMMTSIAQVGAPFSVTSTRQRLGRSGRRSGDPAILRCYVLESEVTSETSLQEALHPELVQAIAIINLLLEGWCEPPVVGKLHLSTLIQQCLSLIAQYGGVKADQAWQVLCQTGAFRAIDKALFIQLLRCLGTYDLIQQSQDGVLLLGLQGERLVNHYSFYTAFQTPEEYRVVAEDETLGTLPVDYPLVEGLYLIFAGYRWLILAVDRDHKVVEVSKASDGRSPSFSGNRGWLHDRIRQEMYRLYCSDEIPIFLNATARDLLQEARIVFADHNLAQTSIVRSGQQILLFGWMGDGAMNTILVQLKARGLAVSRDAITLIIEGLTPKQVMHHLKSIAANPTTDAAALAATVKNTIIEKYDRFLSPELLCQNYASGYLDLQGAQDALSRIIAK
jgi:ATP-dependent Lhr-like helicase